MKQIQLAEGEGFGRLEVVEVETPKPRFNEVLVKIGATSLNYRDLMIAKNPKSDIGRVPLSDGAGEVVAVGEGVIKWQVGDRVAPIFFRDWEGGRFASRYHDAALGGSSDGVLSEYHVVPEHGLVRIPEAYSFEQAATLPCAGVTAWVGLVERGQFTPGESVLLQGTGGVSIWGLQIAVASGGQAIITSSSDEKLARALELGAEHGINYKSRPDWEKAVWELTDKQGVDHVLEVGGSETLGQSLQSVATGGHVAQIGVLTGVNPPPTSVFGLTTKNATLSGIYVGSREQFVRFVRFLDVTKIEPVIDRVFPFEEAREAYEYMESGAHFGKVVISFE
jgi:NADPH:quinone reductase-like Zn-dependent oxidoreductase